jgi:hypothetical protein
MKKLINLLLLLLACSLFVSAQDRIQRGGGKIQINSDGSVTVTLATGKTVGLACQSSLPVSGSVGQMACKSGTGAGVYTWDSGTSAWLLWGDVAAGLNATKIGAGTVSNTEFGYLDGVTSAIQTQLDAKESALTFSSPLSRSVNTISCPTCAVTGTGLNQFASTTSAQLAGVISNETGTGSLVFGTSPNITTPTGIVKGDVGLGNVDNTSDANKPVSTAQQTALDLKANLASPPLTGTPTAPTASAGTSTTQLSTTAFVSSSITNDGTSAIITKPLGLGAAPTSNLDGISPVLLNLKSGTGNHALTYGGQTGVSGSLKMESWVGENAGRVMRWAYDPTGAGALEGYYGDEDGLYTSVGSAGFYFSVTGVNRALSAMGDYYDNGHHTDIEVDDYAQTATVTTVNGTTVNGPLTANQFSSSGATITGGSITGLSTFAAPSVSSLPGTNSFGQLFARSSDGTLHFGFDVNSIAQVWTRNVNTSLAEINLSCTDAGANDTYTCSLSPAITAYATGAHYRFKAATANTGAATLNLNSLGAKTIKKAAGGVTTDLSDNDIRAGQWVDLVYDGTNMQMQSTLGNAASATPAGSNGDIQMNTSSAFAASAMNQSGTVVTTTGSHVITGGTVVADTPVLSATQTWNNSGVTFNGFKLNVTSTASGGSSKLLDLQIAAASKANIDKNGSLTLAGSVDASSNGSFSACSVCQFIIGTRAAMNAPATNEVTLTNSAQNASAALYGNSRKVLAKTADYTVTAVNSNIFFTNTGAAGTVNFTLPTAVVGLQYTFYIDAAQTLTITAGASTTIRIAGTASASAGNITSNTVGNVITLTAISTTQWVSTSHEGTWTIN